MSENISARTSDIVEQILEQGQRLRNAMVKSILDNDPFYIDVVDTKNSLINNSSARKGGVNSQHIFSSNQKQNYEFDHLSPLNSAYQIMSGEYSEFYCSCEICKAYGSHSLWNSKNLPYRNLKKSASSAVPSLNLQETGKPHPPLYPTKFDIDRKLSEALRDVALSDFNKIVENSISAKSSRPTTATTAVQTGDNSPEEIVRSIQDNYRLKAAEYFKYVNSLKITIHSLTLNQAGNRKVQVSSVDSKYKIPLSVNHSYFLEYSIPECLINVVSQQKRHAKVDSGLSKNLYRICSKRLHNEEIYFKHTSIHDIANLLQFNLEDVEIKFQVSCRTMKQKHSNIIGYATFHMSLFEVTKNLCCNQEFPILNDDFVLGTIKITLQLGCGRMYFGKEFVDFVNNNTKNVESVQTSGRSDEQSCHYNTLSSQHADSVVFVDNKNSNVKNDCRAVMNGKQKSVSLTAKIGEESQTQPSRNETTTITTGDHHSSKYDYSNLQQQNIKEGSRNTSAKHASIYDKHRSSEYDHSSFRHQSSIAETVKASASMENKQGYDYSSLDTNRTNVHNNNNNNVGVKENTNFIQYSQNAIHADVENKSLLYGLIYVSEARYFEGPITSYFSCQGLCHGITICSRIVYNNREPIFNFYQKVPYLLDEAFLLYMKSNSIKINFWEKYEEEEIAIGTSQLSLHQFFIAYRNKAIADTLLQNRLPVTISDWWEPICSPVNGRIYGQMKVLVAIGTPAQIHNLEVERGLKDNSSSVTYVPIVSEVKGLKQDQQNMSLPTNLPNGYAVNKCSDKNINNDKRINSKKNASLSTPTCDTSKQSEDVQHQINNVTSVVDAAKVKKVDVGVQSNIIDRETQQTQQKKTEESQQMENTKNNALETLISHLIEQKHKNKYVENATNTEDLFNTNSVNTSNTNKQMNNDKVATAVANKLNQCKNTTNTELQKTSDLLDCLNKALSLDNRLIRPLTPVEDENSFKAHIVVEGALHLPYKRKCRSRKTKKKGISYDEMPPTTYVTFETVPSAEMNITSIVQKSANPQWDYRCDVKLPGEILTNSRKRLIFKVWRKANINSPEPNLQSDAIIGFAALDLTVLLSGLPSVQGWFNIVDFAFKCNGQIKINITPLENLSKFTQQMKPLQSSPEIATPPEANIIRQPSPIVELKEEPSELLNRALKRKFTELEEITQRLRLRLADVTKEDSDTSNDELAEEFEKDISSVHVVDDYNMIDLGEDGKLQQSLIDLPNNYLLKQPLKSGKPLVAKSTELFNYSKDIMLPRLAPSDSAYSSTRISDRMENINRPFAAAASFNSISSNEMSEFDYQTFQKNSSNNLATPCGGDPHLKAGRQRIDQLLEKLTQLSAVDNSENVFSSRYVSGCSITQEMSASSETKPQNNFNIDEILNPALFNRLCSVEVNPDTNRTEFSDEFDSSSNAQIDNDYSSSSLLTQFSTYRQAPDGAGYSNSNNIGIGKQNI